MLCRMIPNKQIDSKRPWKVVTDYLNSLPLSENPITTVTPLSKRGIPLQALQTKRQTRVMGIFNITPDSITSSVLQPETNTLLNPTTILAALAVRNLESASIIDIGGQSTSPRAKLLSAADELDRIKPVVIAVKEAYPHIPLSVDTFYASVAKAAVSLGADIINDISGGTLDSEMLPTVAELGTSIVLMHMRGTPATMTSKANTSYPDGLIPTIARELLARVEAAEAAGIPRWRMILDPGIGFAKTAPQNVEILQKLGELREWQGLQGLPWLVGSSNKRFVARYAGLPMSSEASERIWGTAATVAAAVQGGADIVRVHNVKEMSMVVKVADAIWRV